MSDAACAVAPRSDAGCSDAGRSGASCLRAPRALHSCPPRGEWVAFAWYGGALSLAIRRLKYEDCPFLARPLGQLLRGACRAASLKADVVVPAPLHPRRLAERGYNQSALLARHVAAEIGAPLYARALERTVDTPPQVDLSAEERRANVAAAFAVRQRAAVYGRTVLLVDDVLTTGATFDACRNTLLAAGAQRVMGVVVARTSPST